MREEHRVSRLFASERPVRSNLESYLDDRAEIKSFFDARSAWATRIEKNHALIRSKYRVCLCGILDQRDGSPAELRILMIKGYLRR